MHLSSHPMAVMGTCIRTSAHTCDCGAAPAIRTIVGNEKGDTSVDHLPPAASRWYVVLRLVSIHGLMQPSRAHGVMASHPLRMRKALGSNPSVSRAQRSTQKKKKKQKLAAKKVCARSSACQSNSQNLGPNTQSLHGYISTTTISSYVGTHSLPSSRRCSYRAAHVCGIFWDK